MYIVHHPLSHQCVKHLDNTDPTQADVCVQYLDHTDPQGGNQ